MLFSGYRLDQYADPEGFMAQCLAVLADYPEVVVLYVTEPRTGIQRTSKFVPSIAEIVKACDSRLDHLQKVAAALEFQARKALSDRIKQEQQRAPKPQLPPGGVTYAQCLAMGMRPVGRFEKAPPAQAAQGGDGKDHAELRRG